MCLHHLTQVPPVMTGEGRERDPGKINIDVEKEEINIETRGGGNKKRDQNVNQEGNQAVILIRIVKVRVTIALITKVLVLKGIRRVKIILKEMKINLPYVWRKNYLPCILKRGRGWVC